MKVERRSFLKKLGLGAAVAAVAPSVIDSTAGPVPSAPVVATLGEWNNYYSFSDFAVEADMASAVEACAAELGRRAGLSVIELQRFTYDA